MSSELITWLSIVIQCFIAYHIYFLSRKVSHQARIQHKNKIKDQIQELITEHKKGKAREGVYLVNSSKFFSSRFYENKLGIAGYSTISAGLLSTQSRDV